MDADIAIRAEAIFERVLGYRLAACEVTETVRYSTLTGARLQHTPVVSILKIFARATVGTHLREFEAFGPSHWNEIDVSHTVLHQKHDKAALILPTTLFGHPYDEVKITYVAGTVDIPLEVTAAITDIYALLQQGVDEWDLQLPASVAEAVERYRKEPSN
jgi:hypothetical protein